MLLLGILPLIAFLIFVLIFYHRVASLEGLPLWRTSFLAAACVWGLGIAISSDLLSVFHALTPQGLSFFWILVIIFSVWLLFSHQGYSRDFSLPFKEKISFSNWVLLLGIFGVVMAIILIALKAAPNTWDSMTYHMGRVAHWIQNRSVEYYPTNIDRQLWKATWAETAIVQFQILIHSDQMANLIQTFSMIGTVLASTVIARELGAGLRGQLLSALTVVTIPIGILEASGTQNDYVLAFWLSCLVCFMLFLRKQWSMFNVVGVALSMGLAILTKEPGYIFTIPFLGWLTVEGIVKHRSKLLLTLIIIAVVVLGLNLPHYLRNQAVYQKIISPQTVLSSMTNTSLGSNEFFTNIVANLQLHVVTPFDSFNAMLKTMIPSLQVFTNPLHEDNSGNLLHMFLIMTALIIYFFQRKNKLVTQYLIAVTLLPLLFVLFLSWNRFHARIHLPIFILYAPFIAMVLERLPRLVGIIVGMILLICSLPWVFHNESRPLLGKGNVLVAPRLEQYFANNPGYYFSYVSAVKNVYSANCHDVGLILGSDVWEYPLWAVSYTLPGKDLRFEHIQIKDPSASLEYPLGKFTPCALIHGDTTAASVIVISGIPYLKAHQYSFLSVYLRLDFLPPSLQEQIGRTLGQP